MNKVFCLKYDEFNIENNTLEIYKNASKYRKELMDCSTSTKRKLETLAGSFLLSYALNTIGINELDLEYEYGENKKPRIQNVDNLYFNLSHSGDYIVCAISDKNVGIDIQKISTLKNDIAKRFFTESENNYLATLSSNEKENEFFRIWAIKEAFIKYTGEGIARILNSFNISNLNSSPYINEYESLNIYELQINKYFICAISESKDNYEFIDVNKIHIF